MGTFHSNKRMVALSALFVGGLLAGATRAATVDLSGTFTADNDVVKVNFSLSSAGAVQIYTDSWATGGFDPILSLWDSGGNLIDISDDNSYPTDLDAGFNTNLAAGNYILTLTQFDNFPVDALLADGFFYDGAANAQFTFDNGFGSQPYFNGVLSDNDARTGDWALHLIGVDRAAIEQPNAVPLPAALWSGLPVVVGLMALRRAKSRKA